MTDFSQELRKDFLEEAFELLDNFEKSLLILERNPNEDKAIQEVFRTVHTIKGGAGTVGFDEIQSFMHVLEDVLDLVRKKRIQFKTDDISLLLECRDVLENMLNSRNAGSAYTDGKQEGLMQKIILIKKRVPEDKKTPASPQRQQKIENTGRTLLEQVMENVSLASTDMAVINESLTKGSGVFILRFLLDELYEMKDVSGFQIYALLKDISEIIKMQPSLQELEQEFYPSVTFIIVTEKDETYIRDKTNLRDMVRLIKILKVNRDNLKDLELLNAYKSSKINILSAEKTGNNEPVPEMSKQINKQALEKTAEVPVEDSITTVPSPEQRKADQLKEPAAQPDGIQMRNVATLRVESWKIDEILNLLGELVISKATFVQLNNQFDQITIDFKATLKDFLSGITKLNLAAEDGKQIEKNEILLSALNLLFNSFEEYSESIQKLNRISSSLQENVMNMRMVPIQMVFSRFPRLIRDMADKLNKKIDLIVEGVETEIDKGMVDDIFDPLIHLLRNAVDHGIEMPEERKAGGKPETGRIILKAYHEGDSIIIEVTDDGKGIDVERIKAKAKEGGFISKEVADNLSQKELLGLIFLPGLSTATNVTDLSGRGIGMDVVKKKIEEIGGSVGIATVKRKGSKFIIRLPLTLAIIQGLLVVVKDMHYILPIASVEETVIINFKDLKEINGRLTLEIRDKFVPVLSLLEYFYHEEIDLKKDSRQYCIIAKYSDSYVGIVVSEVIGEQDIVIKPLNTKLIKSPGISAATIIGSGDIGYIIDTTQIISQYFKGSSKS